MSAPPTRAYLKTIIWPSIIVLLGGLFFTNSNYSPLQPHCRCFPTDTCWPSPSTWSKFNQTLGGKLIPTIPLASPCHDTFPGVPYNAEKCALIRSNWPRPILHDSTTHSPMAPLFANQSCDPFTAREEPCEIGTYIRYAVRASGIQDYRATLAFATKHNIRLVIRNTGHDYMGKSTGAGALALWTHHIKDIDILNYESTFYSGKAMKIGAGVQAGEAQAAANAHRLVVVEGDCPTVGIAGGYIQGGGTSPLASKFGLAADQVLEWEVVTGNGEFLNATPFENADLYWALTGGGGGTYGAVLSMTVRLHQNMPTAGLTLTFVESSDTYWDIVQVFLLNMPSILKAGATLYWQLIPGNMFHMPQAYFPGGAAEDFEKLLKPTLNALAERNIPYSFASHDFPSFQDAFQALNPEMNITELNLGGSIVPRSLVANDSSSVTLVGALKSIISNGGIIAGVGMDVSQPPAFPNAVHPGWRDSLFLAFLGTIYNRSNMTANFIDQETINNILDPALDNLTPNPAAYLNEASFNRPNWKEAFYGPNYQKLLSVKKKYDPNGIFWGPTTVGSEAWATAADGRLCETGK